MFDLLNFPLLLFFVSLLALWLAARIGVWLHSKQRSPDGLGEDFGIILSATLTLLGLIIGFTFSMGLTRYDQRKNYEEEEANAIGTEYVRADLLAAADGTKVHGLLKEYLDQRILFYSVPNTQTSQLRQINAMTGQLQTQLWSAVAIPAAAQPTPVTSLVVSGMNDVLNSQGYTQAAWWNRIPTGAWVLMVVIAVFCNLLIGFGSHSRDTKLLLVLPLLVSISFFLIADMDSPRGGVVRVRPRNLMSLAQSLTGP